MAKIDEADIKFLESMIEQAPRESLAVAALVVAVPDLIAAVRERDDQLRLADEMANEAESTADALRLEGYGDNARILYAKVDAYRKKRGI